MKLNAKMMISSLVLSTLFVGGCASVQVQKVENGQAVGPEGVRFYRPRPYVVVHESFPLAAKPYIVQGRLTTDGKYVLITSGLPAGLSDVVSFADGAKVDASKVIAVNNSAISNPSGNQQSASGVAELNASGTSSTTKPSSSTSGTMDLKVTNDNAAFAVQPMRRYFDIAYLPDFDEEYVVKVHSRLGIGKATIQLGQGWSLQGLDANVDNSMIAGPLLEAYADTMKLLSTAAKTAVFGTPQSLGGISGSDTKVEKIDSSGEPVSLKITRVSMASPGVYPILKPKEYEELKNSKTNLSLLMPVPPATQVAFQTYDVLVVEAISATGDSPYRITLYNQPTASSASTEGKATNTDIPKTPNSPNPAELTKQLNSELEQKEIAATVFVGVDAEGSKTLLLTITPKNGAAVDSNAILNILNDMLNRYFPGYTAKIKAK